MLAKRKTLEYTRSGAASPPGKSTKDEVFESKGAVSGSIFTAEHREVPAMSVAEIDISWPTCRDSRSDHFHHSE
jgi:hypothetical protein